MKEKKANEILRRHWFSLLTFGIFSFIAFLTIVILLLIITFTISGQIAEIRGGILFVFFSLFLLVLYVLILQEWLGFYYSYIIFYKRRLAIIQQSSLFKRSIRKIKITNIKIQVRKIGYFQKVFEFGDLIFKLPGSNDEIVFAYVGNPDKTVREIKRRLNA